MKKTVCFLIAGLLAVSSFATDSGDLKSDITACIMAEAQKHFAAKAIKVDTVYIRKKKKEVEVRLNANAADIPFREPIVKTLYQQVRNLLPDAYRKYSLRIITDEQPIESLIPNYYRTSSIDKDRLSVHRDGGRPLITRASVPVGFDKGLTGRHIALWQSHGWYYEQKLDRWEWQRARLLQTVEDLYTQSFVLPYLVPMLENAGACVLLPRERDTQTVEMIVDNDSSVLTKGRYAELSDKEVWANSSESGFAYKQVQYEDGQNPFKAGSARMADTRRKGNFSHVEWTPDIPSDGRYAVYVSYQSLPESTDDAQYTVYHAGGKSEFSVNQQMGGGTWIYLGHFDFLKGTQGYVQLTNKSRSAGKRVTADAIKIGGGMGNIARKPHGGGLAMSNVKSADPIGEAHSEVLMVTDREATVSGYPRFTEAARYWLQWAGMPDSVYSYNKGLNDYTDDYQSRGFWVNYLAGGSDVLPDERGLHIPIDLAFAFHSDAGTTPNDSIIGSLGIFYTHFTNGRFADGSSRYASRDLTDLIQTQIVDDVKQGFTSDWTRRGMWNKSYSEARTPQVPTMLLELLSHQNLADMRYGLDPRFRFVVSRAIYKGMLKFMASRQHTGYVVQPLPVDHFSAVFSGEQKVKLQWQPVGDPVEPTAVARQYIVYTRLDDGAFDNGRLVSEPQCELPVSKDKLYSFKVTAVNEGGESFPSEILSVYRASDEKGCVLIVNGFDRVSAPESFEAGALAGFLSRADQGVPDKYDISYTGAQHEFRRDIPWTDDDAPGFGASDGDFETQVIAGNTFDYPALHGRSMARCGYSFVSCSDEALASGQVNMDNYRMVDLILGKEKQTRLGNTADSVCFKAFDKPLQQVLRNYCRPGRSVLVSGSYVGSDLWDPARPDSAGQDFARQVLRYQWRTGHAARSGRVKRVVAAGMPGAGDYRFCQQLNADRYIVESPDGIEPADKQGRTFLRYSENNISAGVVYEGEYRTCVLGFPFESVESETDRDILMRDILQFMNTPR